MYPMNFNPALNVGGGYVAPDSAQTLYDPPALPPGLPAAGTPSFMPVLRKSVSYFLYFILYTYEGRQVCREYRAGRFGIPVPRAREDFGFIVPNANVPYYDDATIELLLGPIFQRMLPAGPVLHAALRCHISGGYIAEMRSNPPPIGAPQPIVDAYTKALDARTAEYQQYMSVISWALWEGFQDQEFSLAW